MLVRRLGVGSLTARLSSRLATGLLAAGLLVARLLAAGLLALRRL